MPPEVTPESFKEWNPYVIFVIWTVVAGAIGAAVSWISKGGLESYIKLMEFLDKRKKERLRLKVEEESSKKFIDKIIEGKNASDTSRAILLIYDKRLQELENRDMDRKAEYQALHSVYLDCIQHHAESNARAGRYELELDKANKRQAELEDQLEVFKRRLIKIAPPGVDPFPSPKEPKNPK